MLLLTELNAKDGGFLVNGQVMIVAEVEFLEVIGTLDESEEIIKSSDLINKTQEVAQQVKESIDVNGFQVLPSQVKKLKNDLKIICIQISKECSR